MDRSSLPRVDVYPPCPTCGDAAFVRHSGHLFQLAGLPPAEAPVQLLRCFKRGCWTPFRADGAPWGEEWEARARRTFDEMPDMELIRLERQMQLQAEQPEFERVEEKVEEKEDA